MRDHTPAPWPGSRFSMGSFPRHWHPWLWAFAIAAAVVGGVAGALFGPWQ